MSASYCGENLYMRQLVLKCYQNPELSPPGGAWTLTLARLDPLRDWYLASDWSDPCICTEARLQPVSDVCRVSGSSSSSGVSEVREKVESCWFLTPKAETLLWNIRGTWKEIFDMIVRYFCHDDNPSPGPD